VLDFNKFRRRHELGLFLPPTVNGEDDRDEQRLKHVGAYFTYTELTQALGRPQTMTEEALVTRLRRLSAADCMLSLGFIASTMYTAPEPYFRPDVQRELIGHVVGTDSDVGQVLLEAIGQDRPTTIFCEQQVVHLARLVALHADDRGPDDFGDRVLYDDWATCIFGVTDLLDLNLVIEDPRDRLSWELRQCGLNHHDDRLPTVGLHHEIYRVILPEELPGAAEKIEEAFRAYTGISLADFFVVGTAAEARFMNSPGAILDPADYFESTLISLEVWRPFFETLGRGLAGLRAELEAEDERYGATTYGSVAIERFPLFEGEPGKYCLISPWALARRVTEGIFHLLAEAAEREKLDRSTYTGEFGIPFQHSVERTLRRGNAATSTSVPVAADVLYGSSRSSMRRSSDVILGFDRFPMFVEVVSGPIRVGTFTRGNLDDFEADVNRLIISKAGQLDKSIHDFLDGKLILDEIDPATASRIWPVIVTSHAFPVRDEIDTAISERLAVAGYLQDERIAPLAVISAEELFFCEGFMERGETLLGLISGWKNDPQSAPHSFKNFLIEHGDGRAPGGEHFERRFAEAAGERAKRIFGKEESVDDILIRLRDPD
jgi:hypothetical protein